MEDIVHFAFCIFRFAYSICVRTNKNNQNQKYNGLDLQKNIWGYASGLETHTVETHIYRLRKKISDFFKDENFILSHKNGYFIE